MTRATLLLIALLATRTAHADAAFDDLTAAVIADLAAGRPLVAQVHVPLCDESIIPCGNARLGNGDDPTTNLYWSTSPGFATYLGRRGGGWALVLDGDGTSVGEADVLDVRVYRRMVRASPTWRAAGAPAQFAVYVVAQAWRGVAIDRALATFASELSGQHPRVLALPDGTTIEAGGAARLVAYVGHNRLMDVPPFTWPAPASSPRGAIAIACHTAAYMRHDVPAATRAPLLMTRDFLFANAAPLEGAVLAFAAGGGYAEIRRDAAAAYARVQGRPVGKVAGAFTNPAHRRW